MAIEKTRLKFVQSPESGEMIAFVTKSSTTRQLRGVDENSDGPKKICVLSEDLKGLVQPNVVYEADLKPMRKGNGYVVVSISLLKFKAEFETIIIPKAVYQIRITFGHKVLYFDPKDGNSPGSRTINGVERAIRGRQDLADTEQVIERFRECAQELLDRYEKDGYLVKR